MSQAKIIAVVNQKGGPGGEQHQDLRYPFLH